MTNPALSPDGSMVAFVWRGDIWTVSIEGGIARQITTSPDTDSEPAFSPDGKAIAFVSDRTGPSQVYTMPLDGGIATQITFHSERCSLRGWTNDSRLLVATGRDHYWRSAGRHFLIKPEPRPSYQLLFDAYGSEGQLSPDGNKILFVREGVRWSRRGYVGSRAAQLWMYDLDSSEYTKIADHPAGSQSPLWNASGDKFFFVSARDGGIRNLYEQRIDSAEATQLTKFNDDGVMWPCVSRDGKTIVFRRQFDLYRFRPDEGQPPQKIDVQYAGDNILPRVIRSRLSQANQVAFSSDGLEIALAAGGDLWVMDTELREPRQMTKSIGVDSSPVFAPDGNVIYFISDEGRQSDIWKATRKNEDAYWWQNEEFELEKITDDADVESNLQVSPDGKRLSYVRGAGDLVLVDPDGSDVNRLIRSWNAPSYDWSPDSKWIAYAQSDNDFNRDIFLMPVDGSRDPVNLSLHPDDDDGPVWSPDGKVIAFTGKQTGDESDIYFVFLTADDDEETARDRKIKKAIEKIEKVRKKDKSKKDDGEKPDDKPKAQQDSSDDVAAEDSDADDDKDIDEREETDEKEEDEPDPVEIDFEGIGDRVRRISIPLATETTLFWSHDSEKLAFQATIDGKKGIYTVIPPDELEPKLLAEGSGTNPHWISQGNQIVWLSDGVPASLTADGKATRYSFSVQHQFDPREKNLAVFDLCWRRMRDSFYDEHLNNKNWDAIRRKYADAARNAPDNAALTQVVNMMLGELNASHMGFFAGNFSGGGGEPEGQWRETTAHFGLRFDPQYRGPGLKVRDVIYKSPAWQSGSRIEPGEIVLAINSTVVDPDMNLTTVLNGPLERDMILKVKNSDGDERSVTIRPISYAAARNLLYEHWVRQNHRAVADASEGKFGYLHIRGMNMSSFFRFERELYKVAHGKDGLVIDVRENGGGFTTDHLLTSLTQPVHAITVPRGGGQGYPQDRKVYASWNKPIVVLCNQNSFSNAEIFSHAIKGLGRGKLVGVTTAGGVISTRGTRILDVGFLRIPGRGWYVLWTGQDMELNGAAPDVELWPKPGNMPQGVDEQLDKALEILREEVDEFLARPRPTLVPASQRGK